MTNEEMTRLERIMETGFNTLADLIRETNSRLDETISRLDETNTRLGRLEGRFDHLLGFVGEDSRQTRRDVDELQVRVKKLEDAG